MYALPREENAYEDELKAAENDSEQLKAILQRRRRDKESTRLQAKYSRNAGGIAIVRGGVYRLYGIETRAFFQNRWLYGVFERTPAPSATWTATAALSRRAPDRIVTSTEYYAYFRRYTSVGECVYGQQLGGMPLSIDAFGALYGERGTVEEVFFLCLAPPFMGLCPRSPLASASLAQRHLENYIAAGYYM